MKTRLFLIFLLLSAAIFGTMALSIQKDVVEEALWANAGIYGAEAAEILIDPSNPNKVWATSTWTNGLFVTTDAGETWTAVSTFAGGSARGLALDPTDPNTIYVGFGPYILKSTDGGSTWTPHEIGLGVNTIAVGLNNTDIIYAGTGEDSNWDTNDTRIYRSTDGGETWGLFVNLSEECGDKTVVTNIYLHPDPNFILATTGSMPWGIDGNIYHKSQGTEWDCGNATITADQEENDTWFDRNSIVADGNTLYATGGGGLYRSDDLGVTWAKIAPNWFKKLAVNGGRLYGGADTLRYADLTTCTDFSNTDCWTTLYDPPEGYSIEVSDLAFDGNTIYMATSKGVLKSADNGASWSSKVTGMNGTVAWSGSKSEDGALYVGMTDGLYGGSEDGTTWTLLKGATRVMDIVASGNNIFFVEWSQENPVSYSSDAGSTWNTYTIPQEMLQEFQANGGATFDAIVVSGDTVFIGSGNMNDSKGYILKSVDGGANFSLKGTFDYPIRELAFEPGNADVVYAGIGPLPTGQGTAGGIYKTTDGGSTWQQLGLSTNFTVLKIIVDSLNTNIVYAAVNDTSTGSNIGKAYKSEDGGSTWTELWGGLETGSHIGLAAAAVSFPETDEGDRVIYVAFENRMIYYLLDSGAEWTYLETAPYDVNELILGSLYLVTDGGLYRYIPMAPGVDDKAMTGEEEGEEGAAGDTSTGSGCGHAYIGASIE